jgi:hypothetical protein
MQVMMGVVMVTTRPGPARVVPPDPRPVMMDMVNVRHRAMVTHMTMVTGVTLRPHRVDDMAAHLRPRVTAAHRPVIDVALGLQHRPTAMQTPRRMLRGLAYGHRPSPSGGGYRQ